MVTSAIPVVATRPYVRVRLLSRCEEGTLKGAHEVAAQPALLRPCSIVAAGYPAKSKLTLPIAIRRVSFMAPDQSAEQFFGKAAGVFPEKVPCGECSAASTTSSPASSPAARPRPQPLSSPPADTTLPGMAMMSPMLSARSQLPMQESPSSYFTPKASPRVMLATHQNLASPMQAISTVVVPQSPVVPGNWNEVGARLANCFDCTPTSSVSSPWAGQQLSSPTHACVLMQSSPVAAMGSPVQMQRTPTVTPQLKGGALVMHLLQAYQ